MEDQRPPRPVALRARLLAVVDEAPSVRSFRFAGDSDGHPGHLPGQFLWISVPVPSGDRPTTRRPFTISSSPTETGHFQITVKRNAGGAVSRFLHEEAKTGDLFDVRAPFGSFTFRPGIASTIALIGGGSGITPLRSILRYICDTATPVRASLLDVNTTEEDIIFRGELEGMPARHPGVSVHFTLTKPSAGWRGFAGRIGGEHLDALLAGAEPGRVYLCGPPGMMAGVQALLGARGIGEAHILTETFGVTA